MISALVTCLAVPCEEMLLISSPRHTLCLAEIMRDNYRHFSVWAQPITCSTEMLLGPGMAVIAAHPRRYAEVAVQLCCRMTPTQNKSHTVHPSFDSRQKGK